MMFWWKRVVHWCSKRWQALRPGPEARRGAVWGTLTTAAVFVVIGGLTLHTGFGYSFDFAFCMLVAALLIPLAALLVALLLTILRKLPRLSTGFILGACAVVMLSWGQPQLGILMAVIFGLTEGVLGATIGTFVAGQLAQAALSKRILTLSLFLAAIAANIYLIFVFLHAGSTDELTSWKAPAGSMPAQLAAPNPADNGPFHVNRLFYGSGTDIRRPEYGPKVAIKTRTVDASDFFKDFKGWRRWVRKRYWGFDADKLPLNARVWCPRGAGPFPLVLIVHGNHNMSEFSDPGYAYLGELLASRGFILASIDENFLNAGLFHDLYKQTAVRGWLLLEHLKLWREWSQKPGNPFYGKVDMTNIALMGHSRGGEAAATAAFFNRLQYYPDNADIRLDYRFAIQAVVAIAPADGQYKPAGQHRWIQDVSYLTLQGAQDADVSSFMGSRQWDHLRYTQPGPWFKAEIYAYRANHGQFNTEWGWSDAGSGVMSWLINRKPLLPAEEQRRISKTYIAAFLEASLKNRREYLPLFQDWRVARAWLPETLYINRYQDASYVPVAGYQEDADLTTTTAPGGHITATGLSIWHEGRIPWRQGDRDYNGAFLGWRRKAPAPAPAYTITLPPRAAETWRLDANSTLELSIAAMDEDAPLPGKKKESEKEEEEDKEGSKDREAPDFSIELVASDGATATAPVTRFAVIPPPLKERFTKITLIDSAAYDKDWEPVFQTVRAPLGAFQGFDPSKLAAVRLKFDHTKMSVICISGMGFGNYFAYLRSLSK